MGTFPGEIKCLGQGHTAALLVRFEHPRHCNQESSNVPTGLTVFPVNDTSQTFYAVTFLTTSDLLNGGTNKMNFSAKIVNTYAKYLTFNTLMIL